MSKKEFDKALELIQSEVMKEVRRLIKISAQNDIQIGVLRQSDSFIPNLVSSIVNHGIQPVKDNFSEQDIDQIKVNIGDAYGKPEARINPNSGFILTIPLDETQHQHEKLGAVFFGGEHDGKIYNAKMGNFEVDDPRMLQIIEIAQREVSEQLNSRAKKLAELEIKIGDK